MYAIFFDLDGTLADSKEGLFQSFRAGLAAIGVKKVSERKLTEFLGTALPEMFRQFDPDISQSLIDEGIDAFRDVYVSEGIFKNELYSGVVPMLRNAKQHDMDLWIVTSKPQNFAEQVISNLGIESYFSGVVGAGLAERDTKTDLIARALRKSGKPSEKSIMLGDRKYDVIGALENAVRPVGALWGYGSREELEEAGCRIFAKSARAFEKRFIEAGRADKSRAMLAHG